MEAPLPLPALLSQAYVAFAIEFDNEFEHQTPHRTTNFGRTPGFERVPWLVSMPLWLRFLRYVPLEGITAGELQAQLAISKKGWQIWLARLAKWWGYLAIEDGDATNRAGRAGPEAVVRPTPGGRRAIEVWRTLIPLLESRWRERFGEKAVAAMEDGLRKVAGGLGSEAPAHFAILEHEDRRSRAARMQLPARELPLPELLTKVLLAFEAEFDGKSAASLAVCANVLRVTPDEGVRVRDLPRLTCLAEMGVADALRLLGRQGVGAVGKDPSGGRAKFLVLTPEGRFAREAYLPLTATIEREWKRRFGEETVGQLRTALEGIVFGRDGGPSPLLRGLTPHADGWRASLPPLTGLPHFPMVSHRGGFPDGN
ncbi:MAG TPA: hypothetical protein VMD25_08420 [Acidobacteriaceae bacterium]|nr:hypothetical protein [Acidobacteriaceae bacterium]